MERRGFLFRLGGLALLQIPSPEGAWGTFPVPPAVGMSGDQPQESYVLSSGKLTAYEQELDQGYFTVGGGLTVTVVPRTPAWYRLKELMDRPVEIVVRPIEPLKVKRLDRGRF